MGRVRDVAFRVTGLFCAVGFLLMLFYWYDILLLFCFSFESYFCFVDELHPLVRFHKSNGWVRSTSLVQNSAQAFENLESNIRLYAIALCGPGIFHESSAPRRQQYPKRLQMQNNSSSAGSTSGACGRATRRRASARPCRGWSGRRFGSSASCDAPSWPCGSSCGPCACASRWRLRRRRPCL